MIKVDRDRLVPPAALVTRYRGKTEQERVIARYLKHLEGAGDPKDFKFNYTAYTKQELKTALTVLFHGKCAYCESRYAGSQPMDVEHWRPKGQVDLPDGPLPGYYWLASTWTNLLPSCIDCNRSRTQYDTFLGRELLLGKEAQFPVWNDDHLVHHERPHELDPENVGGAEVPLLVNPCLDDPGDYFRYQDGLILPREGLDDRERQKAENSIRVYALNRSALVYDRQAVQRLIEQRVFTLEILLKLADDSPTEGQALLLDELITHEVEGLMAMRRPEQPFSAMAGQLVEQHGTRLGLVELIP
jgi:hypothetical protein